MFAVAKLDLQERGGKAQTTDVVHVDADVLDLAKEGERQVVSVRFHGQIREDIGAPAENFDEIWHLTRFGDSPAWSIAGIQQRHGTNPPPESPALSGLSSFRACRRMPA
jgi:predicted lipid-binding transport protein (Tim44 family)